MIFRPRTWTRLEELSDAQAYELSSVVSTMMELEPLNLEWQKTGCYFLKLVAWSRDAYHDENVPDDWEANYGAVVAASARAVITAALAYPHCWVVQSCMASTLSSLLQFEVANLVSSWPGPAASAIAAVGPGGIEALVAAVKEFPSSPSLLHDASSALLDLKTALGDLDENCSSLWTTTAIPRLLDAGLPAAILASLGALLAKRNAPGRDGELALSFADASSGGEEGGRKWCCCWGCTRSAIDQLVSVIDFDDDFTGGEALATALHRAALAEPPGVLAALAVGLRTEAVLWPSSSSRRRTPPPPPAAAASACRLQSSSSSRPPGRPQEPSADFICAVANAAAVVIFDIKHRTAAAVRRLLSEFWAAGGIEAAAAAIAGVHAAVAARGVVSKGHMDAVASCVSLLAASARAAASLPTAGRAELWGEQPKLRKKAPLLQAAAEALAFWRSLDLFDDDDDDDSFCDDDSVLLLRGPPERRYRESRGPPHSHAAGRAARQGNGLCVHIVAGWRQRAPCCGCDGTAGGAEAVTGGVQSRAASCAADDRVSRKDRDRRGARSGGRGGRDRGLCLRGARGLLFCAIRMIEDARFLLVATFPKLTLQQGNQPLGRVAAHVHCFFPASSSSCASPSSNTPDD